VKCKMRIRKLSGLAIALIVALVGTLVLVINLPGASRGAIDSAGHGGVTIVQAAPRPFRDGSAWNQTSAITFTPAFTAYLPAVCQNHRSCMDLTKPEAEYITAGQYISPGDPAHGAINNVQGAPTWVVPSENAMAILGLKLASEILSDTSYLSRAQLAADYLIRVQGSDGAWSNQYSYTAITDTNKSPRQTAEVMMALYQLGYDANHYNAMINGAHYLMNCQNVANKGGSDDGLLGGGKNEQGQYRSWRWTHDNAYAYWALKAAQGWANEKGDTSLAAQYALSAQQIITGINAYLYEPDTGVWHVAIDANHVLQWETGLAHLPSWIQYAPQMLDLPVYGVNSPRVGQWIHDNLQQSDGACIGYVWEANQIKIRKYPGLSFQAASSWYDTGQRVYADSGIGWAMASGLWQTTPVSHGIMGAWVDWIEVTPVSGQLAPDWQRFIDTNSYAIASCYGGYDFRIP
jgi:hypothetical protein